MSMWRNPIHVYGILDVVYPEPLYDGHPLSSTPSVVISPHAVGAAPDGLAEAP